MNSRGLIDRLFPPKYDFFNCLEKQAKLNALGIRALVEWLQNGRESDAKILDKCVTDADEVRLSLERDLAEAFSTPVDRGEIYLLSVDMDKVIEYARSTYFSMRDFGVTPDATIKKLAGQLETGTNLFLMR